MADLTKQLEESAQQCKEAEDAYWHSLDKWLAAATRSRRCLLKCRERWRPAKQYDGLGGGSGSGEPDNSCCG